ncbi:hypothetical protein VTN77DRAFT_2685 [Rasamsonia byssochlamydoides]|uniref:uncharacterized protein n=1 Tax=Rasamsonia byssochlamydoides TaxID=89139 RepID=UPI0037432EC8
MDLSVESSAPIPSPLGPSFPSSPSHSRKRTFSEVGDDNTEGRKVQPENQENQAPSDHAPMAVDKPAPTTVPENNDVHPPSPSSSSHAAQNGGSGSSALTTLSTADTNMPAPTPSTPQKTAAGSANNPAKKRKLSPASKEAKRLEKEEKERLKLEEKAKKEEERRIKEEEKKKREAEREEERRKREEKRKQKEEERIAKEEEKRKKEEEKLKKERSQMKLSAFFVKPASSTAATSSNGSNADAPQKSSTGDAAGSTTSDKEPEKVVSDYEKDFPEFFVQSHTKLAPQHRFERDPEATEHICQKLDVLLKGGDEAVPPPQSFRGSEMFNIIPYRRRKGRNVMPVKEIITKLQNYTNTIDLTGESTGAKAPNPLELLKKVPMKTLKFGEDVRPPYQGTFTKALPSTTAVKLCKNPFSRALPDTNYDYDSEAEWEEPEEGEDLDSEGEEELSEDGDDDMEGFLDDDEDTPVDGRRRLIVGDLVPVCTGIRWQEESESDPEMQAYRMEIISDTVRFPIDPFSTAYWPKPKAVEQAAAKGSLAPPGVPARSTLHAYSTNGVPSPQSSIAPPTHPLTSSEAATSGKAKRPFPPEQLAEFKQVVEGSDLTKTGLIEVLKKRFPKVSKDVLKDTLHLVAVRVGQKEADKKWVCK